MTKLQPHLKPWMQTADISHLFEVLDNQARFVGGCVRNSLLDLPITDIDIATPLLPEEVTKRLNASSIKNVPTGIEHGTITAVINKQPYEITSLRKDTACDGRHAEVEFTTNWEEDAARRDFTINAMSCSLEGEVYDYHSGIGDLQNGIVRFVGNPEERCQEDYLRILRFFRFFAHYGRKVDAKSLKACHKYQQHLSSLSEERIHSELLKLLEAPNPLEALHLMQKADILTTLLAGDIPLKTIDSLISLEEKLYVAPSALRRFCALLTGTDITVEALCKQLRFSNKERQYCSTLLAHILPPDTAPAEQKKCFRFLNNTLASQDIILLSWALHEKESSYKDMWKLANEWEIPVFPLKGQDLLERGIPKGKEIGKLLKQGENWWEEKHYQPQKKEILEYILKN